MQIGPKTYCKWAEPCVPVEAHEHDVDDDAEGDGQLDEGVEHDEGQHLADLGPDSMGKK